MHRFGLYETYPAYLPELSELETDNDIELWES